MILRITQRFWLIALLFLLLFAFLPQISNAQNARLESQISRLESDIFQIRSRLSNLESQISRVDRSSRTPSPTPQLPSPDQRTSIPPSDAMFDRLATLVIELKERIQVLEKKVAALEENPSNS